MLRRIVVTSVILLLLSCHLKAQEADSISAKRSTLFALPLAFYTPETTWGFGAAGFYSWRFRKEADDSRPSQIQLGGAYTLEDQILAYLPFQLWWAEQRFSFFGELGWYRYNYYFYGVGNSIPADFEELYGVDFPRLRLTLMHAVWPRFYAGVRIIADDFTITELDPEGLLVGGSIAGSSGGLNAGLGFMLNYDSRDNIFQSRSGWYAELNADGHGSYVGSDFSYTRIALDLRHFMAFTAKDFFAVQMYAEAQDGDAPFISQALLGGTRRMRGFYEGRYRDRNVAMLQLEYRRQIIGRLGAVLFASTGAVSERFAALAISNMRYTYGAGLRMALNKDDRINVRFDVGMGNRAPAFYLTIGEAF